LAAAVTARPRHVEAAFSAIEAAGKYLADIYGLARHRCVRAGGRGAWRRILHGVRSARFYSYRRDGVTGRQAT
jgi:copper oxidase (laccase) domain-containing protein